MDQSFTKTDTAVIYKAMNEQKRDYIIFKEDEEWLRDFSSHPRQMIQRMVKRGALAPIGAGVYSILNVGQTSLSYKDRYALIHARLSKLGQYYITGDYVLEKTYHVTGYHAPNITAVVDFENSLAERNGIDVNDTPVVTSRSNRPEVFSEEFGVERRRCSHTSKRVFYYQADLTRCLVDCLWQPSLAGSPEPSFISWGEAANHMEFDPEAACRYALMLGPAVARRTGVMLDMLDLGDIARENIPRPAVRNDRVVEMTKGRTFNLRDDDPDETDEYWQVHFNLPKNLISGWVSSGQHHW